LLAIPESSREENAYKLTQAQAAALDLERGYMPVYFLISIHQATRLLFKYAIP
jgi:hypothetical protein